MLRSVQARHASWLFGAAAHHRPGVYAFCILVQFCLDSLVLHQSPACCSSMHPMPPLPQLLDDRCFLNGKAYYHSVSLNLNTCCMFLRLRAYSQQRCKGITCIPHSCCSNSRWSSCTLHNKAVNCGVSYCVQHDH